MHSLYYSILIGHQASGGSIVADYSPVSVTDPGESHSVLDSIWQQRYSGRLRRPQFLF